MSGRTLEREERKRRDRVQSSSVGRARSPKEDFREPVALLNGEPVIPAFWSPLSGHKWGSFGGPSRTPLAAVDVELTPSCGL